MSRFTKNDITYALYDIDPAEFYATKFHYPGKVEPAATSGAIRRTVNFQKTDFLLEELRRAGASVAVDDFGTGYSSLTYLRELPVDHLKIDRSFIGDLCSDAARSARAVTTAVVALARALGLGTVAEGVETPEQAAVVAELGCDAAQGYLYSRPVPAGEVLELLQGRLPGRLPGRPGPEPVAAVLPRPAGPVGTATPPAGAAGGTTTEEIRSAAHR